MNSFFKTRAGYLGIGLVIGLVIGLNLEGLWPSVPLHAAATHGALSEIYNAVLKFHNFHTYEAIVVTEILRNVDELSEKRRQRLVASTGIVPGIIWAVLFIGAFVTIAFTFFFGTPNLRAQTVMSGALSILIFAGLLTIVAIDQPFSGTVKVRPHALISVINDFGDTQVRGTP